MKLGGVGLKNIIVIWILTVIMTVIAKVLLTKHQVPGVSELVLAA